MMLVDMFLALCVCIFLSVADSVEVVTTTLNSQQERSVAVLDQESFIYTVMLDAATDMGKYSSVMYEKNIEIPQNLLQFIVKINTYEISAFPTSIFISSFPFEDFKTFVTNFPWMSDYLSSCSMTEFKVPSEYSVITTTLHGGEASVATNNVSPTAASSIAPSTSSITSVSSVSSTFPTVSSAARSTNPSETSSFFAGSITFNSSTSSNSSISSFYSSSSGPSSVSSSSHNAAVDLTPGTIFFFIFLVIPLLA